jgi:hypothetical protein
MRNCDGCDKCCSGFLSGTVRGAWFGGLNPCKYLEESCTIYTDRPSQCKNYYCAWIQELLPEWMKPSELNIVASVEVDKYGKQFIKVIYSDIITNDAENEIQNFVTKNNTYYIKTKIIPIKMIK